MSALVLSMRGNGRGCDCVIGVKQLHNIFLKTFFKRFIGKSFTSFTHSHCSAEYRDLPNVLREIENKRVTK